MGLPGNSVDYQRKARDNKRNHNSVRFNQERRSLLPGTSA